MVFSHSKAILVYLYMMLPVMTFFMIIIASYYLMKYLHFIKTIKCTYTSCCAMTIVHA